LLLPEGSYFCDPPSPDSYNNTLSCLKDAYESNGYTDVTKDTVSVYGPAIAVDCKCKRQFTKANEEDSCPSGWTDYGTGCEIEESVTSCDDCTGSDVISCGFFGCPDQCEYYELWDGQSFGSASMGGFCTGRIDYDNPVSVCGGHVVYPCVQDGDCAGNYAGCTDSSTPESCGNNEYTPGAVCGDPYDCTTEPPP
jgi:hypothetical protein